MITDELVNHKNCIKPLCFVGCYKQMNLQTILPEMRFKAKQKKFEELKTGAEDASPAFGR